MAQDKKTTKKKKLTPLMEQYYSIKNQHQDKLLLFRMGDFYELFGEDAITASKVLNITLTQRNKKSGDDTMMCGFPHHSMEAPVNKLLGEGYSVAVCEQLETPSQAKGIVKRGVTMMLSPGVVFDPAQLDQDASVYLAAFDQKKVCFFEHSTGKAFFIPLKKKSEAVHYILRYRPKEVLLIEEEDAQIIKNYREGYLQPALSTAKDAKDVLLDYVRQMQGEASIFGFLKWEKIEPQRFVRLSDNFFKHMEVFQSNEGDKTKGLFQALKKTKSPGGTRLLREWLENPSQDLEVIKERQKGISFWMEDFQKLKNFRSALSMVGDIERRVARAGHPLGNPQDLVRLKTSLASYIQAFSFTKTHPAAQKLFNLLEVSIEEEPLSNWQAKGGFIKYGFAENLDKLISLSKGAQEEIQKLENEERAKQKIPTLKIRFNNVFGFYIEVTKTHKDKVPGHYVRKQTLANAERYTTQELSLLEEKVLSAKSKKLLLEKEVFAKVKSEIKKEIVALKEITYDVCLQDLYSSMAYLAFEKGYSIPEFNVQDHVFSVKESFHPVVVEDLIRSEGQTFITNDFKMGEKSNFYLITGPNMAGKSTMMRQMLLVSYLAQAGLVVPAKEASLPLYDAFFTRVGASDVLSEGLSTFMVEMKETSEILQKASSKSFLILDEIGRGTSTLDGCALAQGIMDYLLSQLSCHSLFATHYHELTEINFGPKSENIHMGYFEKEGDIVFTYKIKKGPSQKSYGIEVARLAGLPPEIIKRAFSLVKAHDALKVTSSQSEQMELPLMREESPQNKAALEIYDKLGKLDFLNMTPLEALNTLSKWQENCL